MDPLLTPKDFKPPQSVKGLRSITAGGGYRESAGATIARLYRTAAEQLRARPALRRGLVSTLVVLLCVGSAMAFVALRPRSTPDIFAADLEDVLDYTLVSDDFNKLPVDERLRLLQEMLKRLRGMDSGDSALMAAFAEGITGKARAQLQKNAERLMVDVWDKFAQDYAKTDPSDRRAYLDQAAIDFAKLGEDLTGLPGDADDDARLKRMKKQAKSDEQQMPGPGTPVNAAGVAGFAQLVNRVGQGNTTPAQRDRMAEFGRDMTRHLRGYEPAPENNPANKKKKPPTPPAQKPLENKDNDKKPDDDKGKDPDKDKDNDPAKRPAPQTTPPPKDP
ncbi:MAG: hypothetical protein ACK5VC_04985 [bacterium]